MELQDARKEAEQEAENIVQFIGAVIERMATPPEPPEGWIGGELTQTGGLVFSRVWVNPERKLGVAYDAGQLYVVVGEATLLDEEADRENPLSYNIFESVSDSLQGMNQHAESDQEAIEMAQAIMEDINAGRIDIDGD